MYKVAVIGGRQDILGFSALGFTVLEAADTEAAREALRRATAGTDRFKTAPIISPGRNPKGAPRIGFTD